MSDVASSTVPYLPRNVTLTNIVAMGVAAVVSIAGLYALHIGLPFPEVSAIVGPIVTGCAVVYQR